MVRQNFITTAPKKFETTSTGIEITGTVVADEVSLGDDDELRFGTNDDLQIFHNSSTNNSVIRESGGGSLVLAGTNVSIQNTGSSETKALFKSNGSVDLYYDNVKKF